jgi:hypothetical protein
LHLSKVEKMPAQNAGGHYETWKHQRGFVEASPSRVFRDGEGSFQFTAGFNQEVLRKGQRGIQRDPEINCTELSVPTSDSNSSGLRVLIMKLRECFSNLVEM